MGGDFFRVEIIRVAIFRVAIFLSPMRYSVFLFWQTPQDNYVVTMSFTEVKMMLVADVGKDVENRNDVVTV